MRIFVAASRSASYLLGGSVGRSLRPYYFHVDNVSVRNESTETKRKRLLYQSRKRGMLENDLILSTFAAKYLHQLTNGDLHDYDRLLNVPSNDWDIYKWIVRAENIPAEFDTAVLKMLQKHCKQLCDSGQLRMPDLVT